jgi:hypothetical protein
MAMENKKVDDIWKQMNARPIVKDTKKFDQVWSKIQQRAEPSTKSKAKGAKKENLPTGTGACNVQVKRTTENALVPSTRETNPTAAEVGKMVRCISTKWGALVHVDQDGA